jgi:hypothetical protein
MKPSLKNLKYSAFKQLKIKNAVSSSPLLSAIVIFALTLLTTASRAQASEEPHGWVGALGGISIPNADNTTSRVGYGVTAGAKLGSEWGLGAYYLTSKKDESASGVTYSFNYDLYGVELAYHFEGEALGAYVGGRVGTSKITAGVGSTQISTSPTHYGLVAGYNYFLNDNLSLGGEFSYVSVGSSSSTALGSSTSVTIDGFSILNFMASVKFWF